MLTKDNILRGTYLTGLAAVLAYLIGTRPTYSSDANIPKYEEPRRLAGTIYSSDRKNVLFKFLRTSERNGNTLHVARDYTYPDGKLALKETVIYEGDRLSEYNVEDLQQGARGSARIVPVGGQPTKRVISFQYLKDTHSNQKPKTATEPFQDNCLVADMIGPFLRDHWSDLVRGNPVKCRYIAVDRRETVGFTFVKDSEGRRGDRNVIVVKMFPTSRIISVLIDPLFLTMEKDGAHRTLEYSGRTGVKVKEGGKWKDLDGVSVFDWQNSAQ